MTVGVPKTKITPEDVRSAVGARKELGDDLEPEVIDAFLHRVERAIDTQVEARLSERKGKKRARANEGSRVALAITSLATAIPLTAIGAEFGGVIGMLAAWAGIVGVNYVSSRERD